MGIGDALKEAREERGLTLRAVEDATKIRLKYIKAMEDDDFSVLPGRVYAKAFLRTYAKYLGLDSESLVAQFTQIYPGDEGIGVDEKSASPHDSRGKPSYLGYLAVLLVIAALVGFSALYHGGTGQEEHPDLPEPPPAVVEDQTPSGDGTTVESSERQGVDLVLQVEGRPSWMRVSVDGEISYEGTVPPGRSLSFSGKELISVRAGDAGMVRAILNGEDLGLLGHAGEVRVKDFTQDT